MNNIRSITSIRKDWDLIESFIGDNSRILDIGCGEGDLIKQLEKNLKADVHGIEKSQDMVLKGISKGLNITQGDAEKDLSQYSNQSFDYVILSQTLQAMIAPKKILIELLRVGSKAIVSFPNFGHWKIRLDLLIKGTMPITNSLPHNWYNTPNIHMCTIKDFVKFAEIIGFKIFKSLALKNKNISNINNSNLFFKNLFGELGIFLIEK